MSSSADEYGFKIFFCDLSTVKWNEIEEIVSDLQHSAIDELGHDAPQEIDFIFSADARYRGQGHEINVPFIMPPFLDNPSGLFEKSFTIPMKKNLAEQIRKCQLRY